MPENVVFLYRITSLMICARCPRSGSACKSDISRRAGPSGLLRSASHASTVFIDTPKNSANDTCVKFSSKRKALISAPENSLKGCIDTLFDLSCRLPSACSIASFSPLIMPSYTLMANRPFKSFFQLGNRCFQTYDTDAAVIKPHMLPLTLKFLGQ